MLEVCNICQKRVKDWTIVLDKEGNEIIVGDECMDEKQGSDLKNG